jgi:4-amino-4-deoxy-L-arabinose transferase-like glycosyltransferase
MINSAKEQWFKYIEKRPVLAVTISAIWLGLLGWLGYLWNLGSIGLIDETEPLFAEASRQMHITGDWITPFFNRDTRFDKPALIYWCQAIAYKIVGVNEWGVRLPSAIAAIAVISLTFYTLYWHLKQQDYLEKNDRPIRRWLTSALAAAMIALCPEMIVWGRTGVSDMMLTGCTASALLCFFLGYAQPDKPAVQTRWFFAFYALIAGAILTKGPVGIVLPGLIIGAFLLYVGKFWQVVREMRLVVGILIILGLAAPWYLLVTQRNGWNYINAFFGYHNLERFTSVVNRHSAPWYFYFIVVLLGFAPYSVYLPVAMAKLKFWQRRYWSNQERSNQFGLFAWFWFAVIFVFFTISVTKLPSYVLPLMPAAGILVALLWSDLFQGEKGGKSLYWSGWVNVAFLSALGIAMFYLTQIMGPDPAAPDFRSALQQLGTPVVGGVLWLVCAVVVAILLLRHLRVWVMSVNLVGFAAFLIVVLMPTLFLMDQQRQLPLRQLAAIATEQRQPNEELVMIGFEKPSVAFYTQEYVNYLRFTQYGAEYIKQKTAPSVLILTQPKEFPKIGLQPQDYENLGEKGAYKLVRVRRS